MLITLKLQNTMRKYNKKVSRGNDSIVKGSFVTVRIPTVDRASGDFCLGFFVR